MTKNEYKPLGQYIKMVDERNRGCGIDNLVGVSFEKRIIPSIANTIGTDLSNYRIIKPRQFAYCPVTSRNGDRISIAMYEGKETAILSVAYTVFEVNESELLPEYLMLWVSRPEFDRYARFMSHGSVRELFSWEEMCNVTLPVPSITEQRRIVNEYQTVERRIKNNETLIQKLEETAQAIYHHTFVEGIDENNLPDGWRMGCLGDFGIIVTGKTPSSDNPEDFGNDIQFMTPADFHSYTKYISRTERSLSSIGLKRLSNKLIPKESIIVTCIGSDMGKIAINAEDCISNQQINSIRLNDAPYKDYVYYMLKSKYETLRAHAAGSSTMLMINKDQFEKFEAIIPSNKVVLDFSNKVKAMNIYLKSLSQELHHLRTLQSLLTSKLA